MLKVAFVNTSALTTDFDMSDGYFNKSAGPLKNGTESVATPITPSATARSTALSNKLTSVLSASYADSEIRDALGLLDVRGVENNAETRRRLRLDAQKEVIDCNGAIVQDFGKVAEVRCESPTGDQADLAFYSN